MGFKIKYNSTNVDRSKGTGIPPNPGIYLMTIKGVKYRKDKDDVEFIVRVKGGDHKGYGFWDYVSLGEASAWKLDQYLVAIGVNTINRPKGSIDLDDFLNKDVMGRVKAGTYNGEPRPELAAVLPLPEDSDEDEDEDSEEEDEEDEDSEEEDEEEEDEEDEDEEEEDEEEEEEEEPPPPPAKKAKAAPAAKAAAATPKKPKKIKYEDMDLAALKAECERRELPTKGNAAALIARLRANDDDPFSE